MRPGPLSECRRGRRAFFGYGLVAAAAAFPSVAVQADGGRSVGHGRPATRSHVELSALFAKRYGDVYRCRFHSGGYTWEKRDGGKWKPVLLGEVLSRAAELGAETYHATGADGEPYPAPDVGGSLETARAMLGLASYRMAAR